MFGFETLAITKADDKVLSRLIDKEVERGLSGI